MFVLLLPACFLFDDTLYDARLAELTATDSADLTLDEDADGWSILDGDCDDADPTAYPDAAEVCDRVDNDCDNLTDEDAAPSQQFPDDDGDGYGNDDRGTYTCFPGEGWIEVGGDCNDLDAAVNPGATEVCNGIDDDCNIVPDNGMDFNFWYLDADGDGWGYYESQIYACEQPAEGWITRDEDCDDGDADVNPGASEVCSDGIDNNCDDNRECGWYGEVDTANEAHGRLLGTTEWEALGAFLTSLGDVDGDDIDDFAAYGYDDSLSSESLYVFRGGVTGDRTRASANVGFTGDNILCVNAAYSEELESYLVNDLRYDGFVGAVYAVPDDASGTVDLPTSTPLWTGQSGNTETYGEGLAISRRLMSTGVEAVLVGRPGYGDTLHDQGAVQVLDTSGAEIAIILGNTAEEGFGGRSRIVSDLDGDGLDDLAVLGDDSSVSLGFAVSVFLSPPVGVSTSSDSDQRYVGAEGDHLGLDAITAADLTGDGHADLVLGAPRADIGRVYVLPGPFPTADAAGTHPGDATDRIDIGESGSAYFGQSLTTGDFDADGNADLAIGAPFAYDEGYGGNAVLLYGPLSPDSRIDDDEIVNGRVPAAVFAALPGEGAYVGRAVLGLSANGDEYTDLLISAPVASVDGVHEAGTTWLILGDGI